MNLEEVKEKLYDLTDMFFKGATIIWTEQMNTKPPLPYVTLKVSGIRRNSFPIVNEEGIRYYQCSTTLEINLYTKGKAVMVGKNVTGNYVNTAVSDMNDFCNFLESEKIVDILAGYGMDIMLIPPVRDLTELQNDSKYRYRSMAEFKISYAEESDGPFGLSGMLEINQSGGGTKEMIEAEKNVIDNVTITEST